MTLDKATLQAVKERILGKFEYKEKMSVVAKKNTFFCDASLFGETFYVSARDTKHEARQACERVVSNWVDALLREGD